MKPNATHQACMADFKAVLGKYENMLSPMEMLALAAQLVGNLIALQDQRAITPGLALEVVERNIEEGNQVAIKTFLGETKGSA